MVIEVKLSIEDEDIRNLLVSAFAGGSNYWMSSVTSIIPEVVSPDSLKDFCIGGKYYSEEWHRYKIYTYPFSDFSRIIITEVDEEGVEYDHFLDRNSLIRGLEVMKNKYPHRLANLLNQDTDSIDGDVYLQCCIFGEIKYS